MAKNTFKFLVFLMFSIMIFFSFSMSPLYGDTSFWKNIKKPLNSSASNSEYLKEFRDDFSDDSLPQWVIDKSTGNDTAGPGPQEWNSISNEYISVVNDTEAWDGKALKLKIDKVLGENVTTGAEIRSNNLMGYGTYIIRMKATGSPGFCAAAFLYNNLEDKNYTEIDVELLSKNFNSNFKDELFMTTWQNSPENESGAIFGTKSKNIKNPEEYHVYKFVWTESKIEYYIDDSLNPAAVFNRFIPWNSAYFIFNIWSGNSFTGKFPSGGTGYLYIDDFEYIPINADSGSVYAEHEKSFFGNLLDKINNFITSIFSVPSITGNVVQEVETPETDKIIESASTPTSVPGEETAVTESGEDAASTDEFESTGTTDIQTATSETEGYETDSEIISTIGNAVWKQALIYSEEFNNFEGWNSDYGGASIINNSLFISGKDIDNDGRYRDLVSTDEVSMQASLMYHWKIKAKLSSDASREGTGLFITLFNFETDPIALVLDRNSIRGDNNIFIAKAGGREWRDNTILSTNIKPELDKWYIIDIYYTFAPDTYWELSLKKDNDTNGDDVGSEGFYAGADGQENADGIRIWNENSVYIDYIKIYNVWKDYKDEE